MSEQTAVTTQQKFEQRIKAKLVTDIGDVAAG